MQLLIHLPDELGERFKSTIPSRSRSAFVRRLIEQALPIESDPLYRVAMEVERDSALSEEMAEWERACIGDGLEDVP